MTKKKTAQVTVDSYIKKLQSLLDEINLLARQPPVGFHTQLTASSNNQIAATLTKQLETCYAKEKETEEEEEYE